MTAVVMYAVLHSEAIILESVSVVREDTRQDGAVALLALRHSTRIDVPSRECEAALAVRIYLVLQRPSQQEFAPNAGQ
jgi:hypothetical protein